MIFSHNNITLYYHRENLPLTRHNLTTTSTNRYNKDIMIITASDFLSSFLKPCNLQSVIIERKKPGVNPAVDIILRREQENFIYSFALKVR
jgi:hypothetical protein